MNEATKNFLGDVVKRLPVAKQFDPTSVGKQLPNNLTDSVSQTREIIIVPDMAGTILMSNEWYATTHKGRAPNRAINESRTFGELQLLVDLMKADEFAPHRSTLGITEDGRLIEGQGRVLSQFKLGKTYTYVVDVVRNDQQSVARYLGATRGTTATTSLAQLWEITFGLTRRQATIAQQMFNGCIWHDEGILGATERSSTKAAVCQQEKLPVDIREISGVYSVAKVPKGISAPALATIELLALRKGYPKSRVEAFRVGVLTGTELRARDPRYVVREFLTKRDAFSTIRYQPQVGYLKSAFDKFITNSDMSKVSAPRVVTF